MHTHVLLFIQDLAVVMLVAGLIAILCYRFKQPIVFGYLLAGMIIGPHTPPFSLISNLTTIHTLAELGVIFLLFSLGLEFNIHKLGRVGAAVFIAAFAEIILMMWLGYQLGLLFHWTKIEALFLGAILSVSSTTIIVKALDELGMKRERFAQLIFGILVLEDIFAIVILAFLSSIAITGSLHSKEIVATIAQLSSFLVISLILGILLIPKLLAYISKFNNSELLLISSLGLCFGFCLIVVKLQYSVALGAFIMGAIIAESDQLHKVERLIIPIRDMFSAIFFVSVGLLLDPHVFIQHYIPIIVITLVVIIGKVLTCSLGVLLTGHSGKTAMRVGMGLSQIGEFSFIIAALGVSLKVTDSFLYSVTVAVSVITTLTTPYLIKHSDAVARAVGKIIPKKIATFFQLYGNWMKSIRPNNTKEEITRRIKSSIMQIVINLCIVIGIFLSGSYLAKSDLGKMLTKSFHLYIQKTIIWSIALILSLPFLLAVYRKMKALSMLVTELSVRKNIDSRLTLQVRRAIAEVIPIVAIVLIMIFISALSARILPPLELLIIDFIIALILIILLSPWLIKLHSKLQINLLDALKKEEKEDKKKEE